MPASPQKTRIVHREAPDGMDVDVVVGHEVLDAVDHLCGVVGDRWAQENLPIDDGDVFENDAFLAEHADCGEPEPDDGYGALAGIFEEVDKAMVELIDDAIAPPMKYCSIPPGEFLYALARGYFCNRFRTTSDKVS